MVVFSVTPVWAEGYRGVPSWRAITWTSHPSENERGCLEKARPSGLIAYFRGQRDGTGRTDGTRVRTSAAAVCSVFVRERTGSCSVLRVGRAVFGSVISLWLLWFCSGSFLENWF